MANDTEGIIDNVVYGSSKSVNLTNTEVFLLNSLPLDIAVPLLKNLFMTEQKSIARSRIFKSLLNITGHDRVQFLLDSFDRENFAWQAAICERLSEFSDPRAINKLCKVLMENADADVRFVAAEALGKIGDSTAIEALKHAQRYDKGRDYEGFKVSAVAKESLSKIKARLG